jgi:hypothetical protein
LQLQSCLFSSGFALERFTDLSTLRGQSRRTFPFFDLKTTVSANVMRFADAVRASVLLRKQEQRATVDELLGSELDETIGPEHITEFAAVLVAIAFAAALGSRIPTANKTKQKIGI